MITITHDKILGFTPRWAPYNGFSLLFDNPDRGFSPLQENNQLMKLDSASSHPTLELYQAFVDALDRIDINLLTNTYLFCPLPPSTYHVTVWDGLNVGNIADVNPSKQEAWADFVNKLPHTFHENSEFTSWANTSSLTQNSDWNITFRFDTLYKWANSAIVARLKPADQESAQILKEIENRRAELYKDFPVNIAYFGYVPHVTFGYFANKESAQLTTPLIADWAKIFEEVVRDLTITYNTISLYGFTDMITFFKTKQ